MGSSCNSLLFCSRLTTAHKQDCAALSDWSHSLLGHTTCLRRLQAERGVRPNVWFPPRCGIGSEYLSEKGTFFQKKKHQKCYSREGGGWAELSLFKWSCALSKPTLLLTVGKLYTGCLCVEGMDNWSPFGYYSILELSFVCLTCIFCKNGLRSLCIASLIDALCLNIRDICRQSIV